MKVMGIFVQSLPGMYSLVERGLLARCVTCEKFEATCGFLYSKRLSGVALSYKTFAPSNAHLSNGTSCVAQPLTLFY